MPYIYQPQKICFKKYESNAIVSIFSTKILVNKGDSAVLSLCKMYSFIVGQLYCFQFLVFIPQDQGVSWYVKTFSGRGSGSAFGSNAHPIWW
jgi:hypothetical protein